MPLLRLPLDSVALAALSPLRLPLPRLLPPCLQVSEPHQLPLRRGGSLGLALLPLRLPPQRLERLELLPLLRQLPHSPRLVLHPRQLQLLLALGVLASGARLQGLAPPRSLQLARLTSATRGPRLLWAPRRPPSLRTSRTA